MRKRWCKVQSDLKGRSHCSGRFEGIFHSIWRDVRIQNKGFFKWAITQHNVSTVYTYQSKYISLYMSVLYQPQTIISKKNRGVRYTTSIRPAPVASRANGLSAQCTIAPMFWSRRVIDLWGAESAQPIRKPLVNLLFSIKKKQVRKNLGKNIVLLNSFLEHASITGKDSYDFQR